MYMMFIGHLLSIETKWRMHTNDAISEANSLYALLQSKSVAIEGSFQSMVYRSVVKCIKKIFFTTEYTNSVRWLSK